MKTVVPCLLLSLCCLAQEKVVPVPEPPVVFRPAVVRPAEKPVVVSSVRETKADNGLFRRVDVTVTLTNPNGRVFEGELELPLPEGATVCGYALDINGTLVPGVVCPKETARIAFENERRKGVDPGVVEHVRGNVWKTRVYPLRPNVPRTAVVTYLEPLDVSGKQNAVVVERDGTDVFVATVRAATGLTRVERLRTAARATFFWDASMSREGKVAADRRLLEALPEQGDWDLVVFRNVLEPSRHFASRADLLAAVDALAYDGGTCLERADTAAQACAGECFIFTDERDEDAVARRAVSVVKLAADEKPPMEPKEGRLLAVAWAANRVEDLSVAAERNKDELLSLGRRYGVASSVTSLLVLDTLEQYLAYKVEPPVTMSFHDEWVRRRAAADDAIASERERADYRRQLLKYWEERVTWWNDPIPPKRTPKSGLFEEGVATRMDRRVRSAAAPAAAVESALALGDMSDAEGELRAGSTARRESRRRDSAPRSTDASADASSFSVTVAAWNPETPYLKALGAVSPAEAYATYLVQRKTYAASPAFYFDCASWFFKAKERILAVRILSNLEEMRLEDIGLWRTMGWRLREAEALDEAIATFRKVLAARPEEPQSRRDLALVLSERAKAAFAADAKVAARDLTEAMKLLHDAAFEPTARRSGRRGNDLQTAVLAVEELNGLLSWTAARDWPDAVRPAEPAVEAAFRRDLPLALRIVLSWDTDETDVDLHVLEPDGEEAYYGHRRTSTGGFVSEDVTTGYGPEEYLRKDAAKGVYRILANYYASHRQALTGPATVTATVYTGWGRKDETRQVLSFRLDKPKEKHAVGEIRVD